MKTICIFNQGLEQALEFFVLEGDFGHLNNTFINATDDEARTQELERILDYDEEGKPKIQLLPVFPVHEIQGDTAVIEVGFIP